MDSTDILALRAALAALRKFGGDGLPKNNVLALAEYDAGALMSSAQREALWQTLVKRRYVASYVMPVTNREQWRITERGLEALACL